MIDHEKAEKLAHAAFLREYEITRKGHECLARCYLASRARVAKLERLLAWTLTWDAAEEWADDESDKRWAEIRAALVTPDMHKPIDLGPEKWRLGE